MNWISLLIGAAIGAILGLLISEVFALYSKIKFKRKYLVPLLGKYESKYKNGINANENSKIEIIKVKNYNSLLIKTINNKGVMSESEIYFSNPKFGLGWYLQIEEDNESIENGDERYIHTFGKREIIIVNSDHLDVFDQYSKDKSYAKQPLQ